MTISSEVRKAGPFNGNDLTTSFPFTFKVFDKGDLRVVRTMPSGIEADLILDSDYSVTLNPDQDATPGGTVTFPISGDPLAEDWKLTIVGDIDALQPTDLTNGGGFYPQVIENMSDRLTMLVQQLAEGLSRAVKVPVSSQTPPEDLLEDIEEDVASAHASALSAQESAAAAEESASRVDLGALDQAVEDSQQAQAAAEGARDVATTSAGTANSQANRAESEADRAEVAREAAEDAVQYDYLVDDDAALAAIVGMSSGQRAFVRDTEHVWRYDGSDWIDMGPGPTAGKLERVIFQETADRGQALMTAAASSFLPLLGVEAADGAVQVPVGFDVPSRALQVLGRDLATEHAVRFQLQDSLQRLYRAAMDQGLIAVLGNERPDGQVELPLAYDILNRQLLINGVPAATSGVPSAANPLPHARVDASVSGTTVAVSGMLLKSTGNVAISGSISISPPAAEPVSGASYDLIVNSDTRWWGNPNAKLPYRFVSGVSVIESGVPLVEGVDYAVWYAGGKLRGISGSGTRSVTISYSGLPQRYDMIVADAVTGALSVAQGTARNIDPEEYRPAVPAGKIPLFSVFSYGSTVHVVPVADWLGAVLRGRDMSQLQAHNRRALAPIRASLQRGDDITLVGYGDSITALAGLADHTVPNGTGRDLRSFFNMYPADTYAALPAEDFGDGGGAIHTSKGWNRQFKKWAEAVFGGTVNYLNYGIGGSSSGTGANGARLNGLNPTRLGYVLDAIEAAVDRVLVNLAFGMNELGNASTLANIISLTQQFQALGAVVQIIGVPRPNAYGGFGSLSSWRYTNEALWQAAIATGAAFVPFAAFYDDNYLGYQGIVPESLAAAASINHAGITEFDYLSRLIISNLED